MRTRQPDSATAAAAAALPRAPRSVVASVAAPARMPARRRLAYTAILLVLLYGAAELIATALFRATVPSVYWLYEDRAPSVRFDPDSGYRVAGAPVRVAKFTRGRDPRRAWVEYLGVVGGNAQGFPDRSDFTPARTDAAARRVVVFGDSFSGGDLEVRWPDRAEDYAAADGRKLELLNFSLSGIGLANWHRMLTRIVAAERYDVDAVVFAVWGNDLARRFYVCDQGEGSAQLGGRVQSWDPADYPKTRADALRWMAKWDGRVTPAADFDAALRGEWSPERPWEPFLAQTLISRLSATSGGAVAAVPPGRLAADLADTAQGRGRLAAEIRDTIRVLGKPVFVVRIPAVEDLLATTPAQPDAATDDDARAFAAFLGATFADGREAFAGLDDETIRGHWFPRDLHWAQNGSDRFARWMSASLGAWLPARAARASASVAASSLPRAPIPAGETR